MNSWTFTGRMISDPNYREVGGTKVCDMTLSVRTRGKDDQGYPKSVLARCTCWRKLAELCAQFDIRKGKTLAVSGMVDLREYTNKDGVLCKSLEVDVSEIDFLLEGKQLGDAADMPATASTMKEAPAGAIQVEVDELPF